MSEWKRFKMDDLIDEISMGPFGSDIKVSCFVEKGIPVLNGSNLFGTRLKEDSFRYVTPEKADSLKKANAYRGDVIVTHRGTLGQIVYIPQNSTQPRYVISQSQFRFRCNDKVIPEYVVNYFHSHEGQNKILANASQVGVPALARASSSFRDIEIPVPPLPTQRKIAAVLSSLDDKIENNRKICANLEAQAQAIFKSWFVDFEPFGGKMPQGWKMGKLGDVCKIFDSRRIPLSSLQRAEMQGDIPYYGATSIVDYVNDFLLEGIYLLMGEDGSVITDKGYPFLQYIWGKFWPNNHAHVLQGTNGYTTEMLYCLLSQTKVERYVTGAVQPKISQGNMIMIPACIPGGSDAKSFSGIIQPLFDELRCKTDESRSLAALRDALLPKLMSGEIDVEKVKVA